MSKKKSIIIRVDTTTKQQIEDAARRRGQSLSRFVIGAALVAARKQGKVVTSHTASFKGVPRFFAAVCQEATYGGASGYFAAGYELLRHAVELTEGENDFEKHAKLDELAEYVREKDGSEVFGWYETHFPKCAAMIPVRRRQQFVDGVLDAFDTAGGIPGLRG